MAPFLFKKKEIMCLFGQKEIKRAVRSTFLKTHRPTELQNKFGQLLMFAPQMNASYYRIMFSE
jgi:hypothetical protein